MAENVYEGMFILDSNRYARDGAGASRQVEQMIEAAGGQLLVSRLWEERRLAYPIKRHRKGAYWLTYFRLAPDRLVTLNRQSKINELVLRHLVLKVDPRIVDTLISHVQAHGRPSATTKTAIPAEKAAATTGEAASAEMAAATTGEVAPAEKAAVVAESDSDQTQDETATPQAEKPPQAEE